MMVVRQEAFAARQMRKLPDPVAELLKAAYPSLLLLQVEASDTFEGLVMLQSLAGGTGAGAGTYLAQALVDTYSNAHMINCCVW